MLIRACGVSRSMGRCECLAERIRYLLRLLLIHSTTHPRTMKDLSSKSPYFGMTGTQLNIWVTVACTTAMTLFGDCDFTYDHVYVPLLSEGRLRPGSVRWYHNHARFLAYNG